MTVIKWFYARFPVSWNTTMDSHVNLPTINFSVIKTFENKAFDSNEEDDSKYWKIDSKIWPQNLLDDSKLPGDISCDVKTCHDRAWSKPIS